MKIRAFSFVLAAMAAWCAAGDGLPPIEYLEWDGSRGEMKTVVCTDYRLATDDTEVFSDGVTYVVSNSVWCVNSITVEGASRLILLDGASLWATFGIRVNAGRALTICGQSGGTGVLRTSGGYGAGIGGGDQSAGGTVTINGGTVTATSIGDGKGGSGGTVTINGGTVTATSRDGCAGIGGTVTINGGTVTAEGGFYGAGIGGGNGGTVTINGGTVTATGGSSAAGIGGGWDGSGGMVTINGGTVTATGRDGGAGIGGGFMGSGGTVTINGGMVTATGGDGGAGIGGGEGSGGIVGSGGAVTINGGTVTATGGANGGAGIGGGKNGSGGTVTINGGTVMAEGGLFGAGIGGGKGDGNQGSLTASARVAVKAGAAANPTAVKAHGAGGAIELLGERYYTAVTSFTSGGVPYEWLHRFYPGAADYEAAAAAMAANGRNTVGEAYVAGLDPTNEAARFTALLGMTNGLPYIDWSPNLNTDGKERVYQVWGRASLDGAEDWARPVTPEHRFFRVTVELPDGESVSDEPGLPYPPGSDYAGTPYGGEPHAIPGSIPAVEFDEGGEGVAYHDTYAGNDDPNVSYRSEDVDVTTGDGGYVVGYTAEGEWLKYTVTVAQSGTYSISARASTGVDNFRFRLYFDDAEIASFEGARTGDDWETYVDFDGGSAYLPAGTHILKLEIGLHDVNVSRIRFELSSASE